MLVRLGELAANLSLCFCICKKHFVSSPSTNTKKSLFMTVIFSKCANFSSGGIFSPLNDNVTGRSSSGLSPLAMNNYSPYIEQRNTSNSNQVHMDYNRINSQVIAQTFQGLNGLQMSRIMRKPVFRFSDQVRYNQAVYS